MADLFKTKYPNNQREVSGTPQLFRDDVVLLCDTSGAPVVINLFDIPENFWSTTWKLYVVDNSGNASANSITINAGAGQLINGSASLTISTDNGSALVRIGANATYVASLSNTGGGSNGHVIEDEGVALPQQPVLNFIGDLVTATDGAGKTDVTIDVPDTGWLAMQGFTWMGASVRPQYRVINKSLQFRRQAVVPIETAGVIVPWTSPASYLASTNVTPATVDPQGVIINPLGAIIFNQGNAVLQSPSHYPDESYTSDWVIATQRRQSQAPVGASYSGFYTTVFRITIAPDGIMSLQCLKDAEQDNATQQIGQSSLRYLVSQSIAGDQILDYRDIKDSGGGAATLVGRSNTGTANDPANIGLNTDVANHNITHDPANETDIGGYIVPLITIKGFLA